VRRQTRRGAAEPGSGRLADEDAKGRAAGLDLCVRTGAR
jgi:hypothetical protein